MTYVTDLLNDEVLIAAVREGNVAVMPTDTVYGIVCTAKSPEAVATMFQIKARENAPGTILAANVEQLIELGLKARYVHAVEQYWPNAISVIIPCDQTLSYLHMGKNSLACRIPNDENLRKFLEHTGPLMTSSANEPGMPPAQNVQQAKDYFGEAIKFWVNGGEKQRSAPSTIIRVVDDAIEIVRSGAVKINENGRIYQ